MPNIQREADERAYEVMRKAHAFCPSELAHLDKMRWMAAYFVKNYGAAIDQSASHASLEKLRAIGAAWMGEEGRDALEDWIAQQAAPEAPTQEDPRITAFYKLRDIAERDEDIESANIIQSAISKLHWAKVDAAATTITPEDSNA